MSASRTLAPWYQGHVNHLILPWSIPAAALALRLHGAGGWIVAGMITATVLVQAVAFMPDGKLIRGETNV